MGILHLVGNDTSHVVLNCFVAKLYSFVFPAIRGGGHFEFEPKNGFAIGGFWWAFLSGYMVPQRACCKWNGFDTNLF